MDLFIFSQVQSGIPNITNWWQLIAFLVVMGLQAYGMYINSQRSSVTQDKIDKVGSATELVHKSVNSQLDAFKKEAAEQYQRALEQGVAVVRLQLEKAADAKTAAMESRISVLESKLDSEREKAVTLAAQAGVVVVKPDSLDPAARLQEIRGSASK